VSNRLAHRDRGGFRRCEDFVQHRLRRPNRSARHERRALARRERLRARREIERELRASEAA